MVVMMLQLYEVGVTNCARSMLSLNHLWKLCFRSMNVACVLKYFALTAMRSFTRHCTPALAARRTDSLTLAQADAGMKPATDVVCGGFMSPPFSAIVTSYKVVVLATAHRHVHVRTCTSWYDDLWEETRSCHSVASLWHSSGVTATTSVTAVFSKISAWIFRWIFMYIRICRCQIIVDVFVNFVSDI